MEVSSNPDDENTGTQLWNAEIGSIQKLNMNTIPKLRQFSEDGASVGVEVAPQKTADILDHDRTWRYLFDKAKHLRKEISFIFGPELLSGNAEGGAWNPAGQQINFSPIRLSIEDMNIFPYDIPIRTVCEKAIAILLFILDERDMVESGHFQPQCLSSSAGAYFQ